MHKLREIADGRAHDPQVDDGMHTPFGETIYTLLQMYKFPSQGFLYGLFVYGLQMSAVTLTMVDVVPPESPENPLELPAMVGLTVTCAQAIALFMLLAYTSDLIEAVLKLQDGYYPETRIEHSGASYPSWLFSCVAQSMAGLLLLAASFIL